MTNKIITRFAPSPTGLLHSGNYRTAIFAYLFARKNNGKFILRIEDTDKERSKKEYEDNILDSLKWLDIEYDEFFRQSERTEIYKKYLHKLLDEDKAYVSKENAGEGKRGEVIRFRNPNKIVTFKDAVKGIVSTDTTDLGDFVIAKSIDEPIFHLVVVVDDYEMGVTHVMRGDDHLSNTPRHILIQEAIGAPIPMYVHFPLVLSPDRSKLSKRKGALAITEYRARGYLPSALVNYLVMVGWNPGSDREIFTMYELIDAFSLEKIQKGAAIFDDEKLLWMNKEHLKKMSDEDFRKQVSIFLPEEIKKLPGWSEEKIDKLLPELRDRINVFSDLEKMAALGELQYFFDNPKIEASKLMPPKEQADAKEIVENLRWLTYSLSEAKESDFSSEESIKKILWDYATEKGRGKVLWPMRYALSGKDKSPNPFVLANVLGKKETVSRLQRALEILN